jgi:hypothetical protein
VLTAVLDGQDVERVVGMRAIDYGWVDLKDRYEANTRLATTEKRSKSMTQAMVEARAEMLIRRPVAEVFEAFCRPAADIEVLVHEGQRQAGGW